MLVGTSRPEEISILRMAARRYSEDLTVCLGRTFYGREGQRDELVVAPWQLEIQTEPAPAGSWSLVNGERDDAAISQDTSGSNAELDKMYEMPDDRSSISGDCSSPNFTPVSSSLKAPGSVSSVSSVSEYFGVSTSRMLTEDTEARVSFEVVGEDDKTAWVASPSSTLHVHKLQLPILQEGKSLPLSGGVSYVPESAFQSHKAGQLNTSIPSPTLTSQTSQATKLPTKIPTHVCPQCPLMFRTVGTLKYGFFQYAQVRSTNNSQ